MDYNQMIQMRKEELINNPSARLPICLCLDTSWSMNGQVMDELNKGVKLLYDQLNQDEIAKYSAEICIVTFGEQVKCEIDFASLSSQNVKNFVASGGTPMGEGINLGLDLLEKRVREYSDLGIDFYTPWLIVMTDGEPNGNKEQLLKAMRRTAEMSDAEEIFIFAIGMGPYADMNVLSKISPKRMPLKLKGLNFKEFFTWLSSSVATTSQSVPGEVVPLDLEGIKSWATL